MRYILCYPKHKLLTAQVQWASLQKFDSASTLCNFPGFSQSTDSDTPLNDHCQYTSNHEANLKDIGPNDCLQTTLGNKRMLTCERLIYRISEFQGCSFFLFHLLFLFTTVLIHARTVY